MQQSTSRKISYLQFVCALMVIAQHTVFASYFVINEDWLRRFNIWVRDMNDAAVSTFFLLSGILLMRSTGKYSWWQIMLKKLKTIALPYALWIVVYTVARIVRGSFAAGVVLLPTFAEMIEWIRTGPEYYIFWFLRALLGMTALYPVLMWAIRKRWPAVAILLLCPALVLLPGMYAWIPFESIIYWMPPFLLGCWIGMEKMPWFEAAPRCKKWWVYTACLVLFLLSGWLRRTNDFFYYLFWTTGPFMMWVFADTFSGLPAPPWWINASFFMYCCHMLVERYGVRLYLAVFGTGRKAFVLGHLLLPVITGIIVLLVATLLRWLLPWLYQAMTGLRRPDHRKKAKNEEDNTAA